MMTTIIVAYNYDRVIGDDQGIPWHIPDDLKLFKNTTMGCSCLMGRKTWESIPDQFRPLPGRLNLVVTKDVTNIHCPPKTNTSLLTSDSIERAIDLGKVMKPDKELFIIGGAQIYNYCLEHNLVDRVLASEIHGYLDVKGTAFFPTLNDWNRKLLKEYPEFVWMEYTK